LGSNGVQKPLPQRHTPSKEKSLEGFRLGNRAERKGLKFSSNKEKDERVPGWITPVVRLLCRELQTTQAVPHVLAGVESVLCLPPPEQDGADRRNEKEEERVQGNLPALVAAVWFFVSCRMLGKETDGDEYVNRRKVVLDVLRGMRDNEGLIEKVGKDEKAWEGWGNVEDGDVTAWVKELTMRGWLDLDWFLNIEIEETDGVVEGDHQYEWVSSRSREELGRVGLGSMKLERHDYLSGGKRKAYKRWKVLMLMKIEEMIREGALDDEMDTREG
jgi:origin recognition complex subunit 6